MKIWRQVRQWSAAFPLLKWCRAYPAQCPRERAMRTQEMREWKADI